MVGRLRTSGLPEIESAVDEALARCELEVVDVEVPGFDQAAADWATVFFTELWEADHRLADEDPDGLGDDIKGSLALIDLFRDGAPDARARLAAWRPRVAELFTRVELLALPTLPIFPYRLDEIGDDPTLSSIELTRHTVVFNASGSPCLALPVPVAGSRLPASLQLVGPHGGEDVLLATGARVEAALG